MPIVALELNGTTSTQSMGQGRKGAPVVSEPGPSALLDETVIASLLQWLGATDVHELMTEFQLESARSVEQIKMAAAAEDMTAVGEAAHALAGMSSNVGAARLADIARHIAMACRDIEDVRKKISTVDLAWRETRDQIGSIVLR